MVEVLPSAPAPESGPVLLGHVAKVSTDDLALAHRLVNQPLGSAPWPGQSRWFGRAAVERSAANLAGHPLQWSGAALSEVTAAAQEIAPDRLVDAASAALPDRSRWLARPGAIRPVLVPPGPVTLRPRVPQPHGERSLLVWVDVEAAGAVVRTIAVPFLREGDASAPRSVANAEAVVKRGQWAQVRSGAGRVAAETRVEVLQDGRAGQKVVVRAQGGPSFPAFVRGPGELEMAP